MSKIVDGIMEDLKALPEKIRAKTESIDKKKLFLLSLPYLFTGYFCNKAAWLWRQLPDQDLFTKVMDFMERLNGLFRSPLPSLYPKDLLIGTGCGMALYLIMYYKKKNAKKFRHGMEYGSARWGTEKDIEPYIDPVFENNIPLTQTERLMMSSRPKNPKYARNKNILVIGDSVIIGLS